MTNVPKEITIFLNSLLGRSPQTRDNYDSFARNFWRYVGKKTVEDITITDILGFLNDGLTNKKWKASTMRQYATISLLFFNEFKDEAFMKKLRKEMRKLPRVQANASLYEGLYIPPDKIEAFIEKAPDEEWAVLYTMILKMGLRIGEALRLLASDINPALGRVVVRGKGFGGFGKIRQVIVEKDVITRILKFAGCSPEQIEGKKQIHDNVPIIKNIKERNTEYQWKYTAKKIGLKNWKQLTPHGGRHAYAIDFLTKRKKQGMAALVLLKNQLGHTNIQTTMIYLNIAGGEAQDIFNAGINNNIGDANYGN